jgi:hypothetical protein
VLLLVRGLDALGHGEQAQGRGELHDGAGDDVVVGVAAEAVDEQRSGDVS